MRGHAGRIGFSARFFIVCPEGETDDAATAMKLTARVAIVITLLFGAWASAQPVRLNAEREPFHLKCQRDARAIFISPTHDRLLFVSPDGKGVRPVVDGVPWARYDRVAENSIVFSADGKRVAFAAEDGRGWFVVIDGKEHGPYAEVQPLEIQFSPDGKRLAYAAKSKDRWSIICDDLPPVVEFDAVRSVRFSASGKLSYAAQLDGRWTVLVELRGWAFHEDVASITSSPDGQRVAYLAKKGDDWTVMEDGKVIGDVGRLQEPFLAYHPDGRHFVYVSRREGKSFLAVGKVETDGFEAFFVDTLGFSPDGERWACAARKGGRIVVLIDGKEVGPFERVAHRPIVMTRGARRHAFVAEEVRDGRRVQRLVVDGQPWDTNGEVSSGPVFSDDGRNVAAVIDGRLVVNDVVGPASFVVRGTPQFNADGDAVRIVAVGLSFRDAEETRWDPARRKLLLDRSGLLVDDRLPMVRIEAKIESGPAAGQRR
jgi:hypothetical protein